MCTTVLKQYCTLYTVVKIPYRNVSYKFTMQDILSQFLNTNYQSYKLFLYLAHKTKTTSCTKAKETIKFIYCTVNALHIFLEDASNGTQRLLQKYCSKKHI